jgi:two-component system alkaline phosphatase synthesis response regulator PhoP
MKKIFLIDDEKSFCYFLKKNLEKEGDFAVVTCSESKEALKIAKEFMPDIILIDIMMPEMDGTEVAQALKEDQQTKNIPFVFLTALATRQDTEGLSGLKEAQGNYYICKPVEMALLLEIINKLTK